MRAPHPCPTHGCRRLVHGPGHCTDHDKGPWSRGGRTRQQRGYGAEHVRLRAQVLREEPCCAECGTTATPTMDHIIPLYLGGQTVRSNVRRLCAHCQQEKASREGNQAKARGVPWQ